MVPQVIFSEFASGSCPLYIICCHLPIHFKNLILFEASDLHNVIWMTSGAIKAKYWCNVTNKIYFQSFKVQCIWFLGASAWDMNVMVNTRMRSKWPGNVTNCMTCADIEWADFQSYLHCPWGWRLRPLYLMRFLLKSLEKVYWFFQVGTP